MTKFKYSRCAVFWICHSAIVIGISSVVIFSLFLPFSCSKSPVGFAEMERDSLSHFKKDITPEDSLSFGQFLPCGRASNLFLGKNDKYEARILLSFPLIDSSAQNITKITIHFYTSDTANYRFKIYPLTTRWNSSATWRMASEDVQWKEPGGDFLDVPLAEGVVQKDSFSLEIPRPLLETILHQSTGFIILAEENRHSFRLASIKTSPRLIFTYGDKERVFLPQFATYIVNFLDTIPSDYFVIGSGYVFWTYLRYPHPLASNFKIAEGEMILSLDLSNSYFLRDTLEVAVFSLKDSFARRREKTPFEVSPRIIKTVILPRDSIVSIPVKNLLVDWQNNPEKNFGIFLTLYPEYRFPSYLLLRKDKLSFRINFTYIPPVKDRFP